MPYDHHTPLTLHEKGAMLNVALKYYGKISCQPTHGNPISPFRYCGS